MFLHNVSNFVRCPNQAFVQTELEIGPRFSTCGVPHDDQLLQFIGDFGKGELPSFSQ